ncbi:hypothetical protein [Avibacterium endocarditidis]
MPTQLSKKNNSNKPEAAYNNDFDTAFKLFQSLEKQGVSEAEYNLGLC